GLMLKATQQQTKQHNQRLILRTIFGQDAISRANIARATGLTRTTVSQIVAELLEEGLVEEIGRGPSAGGKRPILLSLVADSRTLIGIDLANSVFYGGVFNLRGEILHKINLPVNESQADDAINLVYELIDQLIEASPNPIIGVGLGTPGVTDARNGVVYEAVNLGWHNLPLQALLRERYDVPIHIANDSQVAALGEYLFGSHRETTNLVVVKVGRGIGAGIVLNGELFIGERFGQGEIGHVVVAEDGPVCRCGLTGCLETVASSRAVVQRLQQYAMVQPAWPLAQLGHPISVDDVIDIYPASDPVVDAALREAGKYLGIAVAHLVAILNVQHVVLGGRMAHFGDTLVAAIKHELGRRLLPKIAEDIEITISDLGENIVIQGGAALLLSRELGLL
ncbi:MAG: ROK family protein, partial [Anaerolineales bacterium]|nr:ROK family protein [Anaerolineales bacterium]